MQFDLNKTIETIKNNKDFLKLKKVIENNEGHDNERVYDHSIKTFEIAQKMIDGNFIKNPKAKTLYEDYLDSKIDGINKKDLIQISALIHDIGKIIVFENRGQTKGLLYKTDENTTYAPEHGYWGSLIVPDVLMDLNLSDEVVSYLSKCVRLHLAGFNFWFDNKLTLDELLWELRLRCENIHVEVILSVYSDLYYGNHFKQSIYLPLELLNMPETYEPLKYKVID